MDIMGDKGLKSAFDRGDTWRGELVRFVALAILGTAASYFSVNIPYTEALIEGRWIFGYMGFALLHRWWMALLLACLLSITRPYGLSLGTVLVGNMLYAFPFFLVIRTLHNRVMDRWRSVAGYGLAWLLIILIGYQAFTTPAVWGFLAFLHDNPIWPAVLEGWREQPYLVESLLVGIISALAMMVQRSNTALRASRRELATTLYSIGDGVIATDVKGRIQRMNPVAEHLTGWNETQAIGRALEEIFDIVNEETRHPVESPVARVLHEGMVVGLANHTLLISQDGREIPIADSGAPIRDPQGNVTGVVLVFRDQTEERLSQRLTQTRLALIEYAASHTLEELLTHALDKVGAFVDSPVGFYHLLEADQKTLSLQRWSTHTPSEFCQAQGRDMHHNLCKAGVWADCVREKKPVIHNDYASLPRKKAVPAGHAELIRELVVPVIREDKVVAILGVGNKPTEYTQQDTEIVSYLADVTWEIVRQKQTESQREAALEALRQEKAFTDAALDSQMDTFFLFDPISGQAVRWNKAFREITGYTDEEIAAMPAPASYYSPEDLVRARAHIEQVLQDGSGRIELELICKDGTKVPTEYLVSAMHDTQDHPEYFISIGRDITERKRAAKALRESEKQYQHLFNSIADTVFVHDLTGRILDVNHKACTKYGYSREEIRQINASDVDAPDQAVYFQERTQRLLQDGEIVFETVHLDRAKNRIPMEVTAKLTDYKGRQAVIAICHDITERLQAESQREAARQALQDKSDEQALLLDTMDAQVWYLTDMETYGMVNRAHAEFLGLRREEVEHKRLFEFLQQEVAQVCKESNRQVFETKQTVHTEEWVPNAEGQRRLISIAKTPHLDQAGKVEYVVCVGTDITERKQMEEALRESEEKYRALITQSADCLILHDMDARIIEVNPWSCDTFGYSRQELLQMKISDLDPDYVAREAGGEFWNQLSPGESVMFEARQQKKDGTIFPVEVRLSLIKLHGQTLALGLCRDITERKRSESQREAALEALSESEEKYRLLFDNADMLISVYDREGVCQLMNRRVAALFGSEPEELIGQSFNDLHPEAAQEYIKRVRQAIDSGTSQEYKDRVNFPQGDRWLLSRVHPVPDAQGVFHTAQILSQDITERVQAESQRVAALKERERLAAQMHEQTRQIEQILATVPAGVLLLDTEGQILQVNPVAEKYLNILADAGVGDVLNYLGDRSLTELLTSPPTQGLWHKVEVDNRTFEVIARPMVPALSSSKEPVLRSLLSSTKGSSKEPGPTPEHWVLVINDVTQEQEVRKRLEQQERLAAVGQLAAGIAHDFNNIMATIILYGRMIERSEGLSQRDRERLSIVNQQAWHATRLIEQILDFSRRAVLERRPLDLLPLLKEQVKLLRRTLPEHIEIDLIYGRDEYTVHADPTRMQQMLTNLAVNARDAMPNGGTLRVQLERVTVEAEEWIRLTALDTGTGIAPDVLPHIFEPFFTTKEPGQGSGLGLAQVHGIVGLHGGRIDVSTEVGQGTTFTIYLPALAVHSTEPPSSDTSALPQGQGELVLVVEDGDAVRAALVESLEGLSYRVLEAINGQEALTILEAKKYKIALIVSDVVMPEMGGIALFHALSKRGWQTPVILLTGHPMDKELEALQNQGLSAWLTKPPNLERLAQAIADALRR